MCKTRYYKVTNETENHRGFQYKDGLNIDTKNFNNRVNGLYFCELKYIHLYFNFGINLREIFLPTDRKDFSMEKCGDENTVFYRANMVILGEKLSLLDTDTYKNKKLNIYYNMVNIFNIASKKNYVDIIKKIFNERYEIIYNEWAINIASANNNSEILDLWKEFSKEKKIKLKYNEWAINNASANGHIGILEWWIHSDLKMLYDEWAIIDASKNGQIEVLNWWVNSWKKYGLIFKYNSVAVTYASRYGQIDVLEWWKNVGTNNNCIFIRYNESAFNEACAYNQLDTMKWWINSGLKLKYTDDCVIHSSKNNNTNILDELSIIFSKDYLINIYYQFIGNKLNKKTNINAILWWQNFINK